MYNQKTDSPGRQNRVKLSSTGEGGVCQHHNVNTAGKDEEEEEEEEGGRKIKKIKKGNENTNM